MGRATIFGERFALTQPSPVKGEGSLSRGGRSRYAPSRAFVDETTSASLGRNSCSSGLLYGTGVCGPVTRLIGPSRLSKALSAMTAETSEAMLARGESSSTITTLLVDLMVAPSS